MALGKGLGSLIPLKHKQEQPKTLKSDARGEAVWHIPLNSIVPGKSQPRTMFNDESLGELAQSIKEKGVLTPILVAEREDGKYDLVAGERRVRAAAALGLATVPAIVRTANNQEKLEIALIENVQREDLNIMDEAFAYKRLIDEFGLGHEEVAKRVGKSRPEISNKMRLLDLPEEVQTALREGVISMGKARALLSLKDEKDILETFHSMSGKRANVRDVEDMIIRKKKETQKGVVLRHEKLLHAEKRLKELLNTKVRVTGKFNSGKIIIEFYSEEEFNNILAYFF